MFVWIISFDKLLSIVYLTLFPKFDWFQYLKDHGEGDDISLEFKDGSVSIIGKDCKPDITELAKEA